MKKCAFLTCLVVTTAFCLVMALPVATNAARVNSTTWDFDSSAEYTFDDRGVEVTDSMARLKRQGTGLFWSQVFDRGFDNNDLFGDCVVDSECNVIAVGTSENNKPTPDADCCAVKYDRNGELLWTYFHDSGYGEDGLIGVTVDENDNIYATGSTAVSGAPDDLFTVGLDPEGNVLDGWPRTYNRADNTDWGFDIILDSAGELVISGMSMEGTDSDVLICKYERDGTRVSGWPRFYDFGGDETGLGLVQDGQGYYVVTGGRMVGFTSDAMLCKFDPAGEIQTGWPKYYDAGIPGNLDVWCQVDVDRRGEYAVGGATIDSGTFLGNVMLAWYDPDGTMMDSPGAVLTGDVAIPDVYYPRGVVEANNNLLGHASRQTTTYEALLFEYRTDGTQRSTRTYMGPFNTAFGLGVALDPSGFINACGVGVNPPPGDQDGFVFCSPASYDYPIGRPTVTTREPAPTTEMIGFAEQLGPDNRGSVEYQLSNNGENWYYHDGSSWTAARSNFDTNTAAEVDESCSTFSTDVGTGELYVRAFLVSNGSQQVELDAIAVEHPYIWYLAEGSTGGGFETWISIQNLQEAVTRVDVTFTTQDGPVDPISFDMLPESRSTVRIADHLPDAYQVSTIVKSNSPVVAERAMYWDRNTEGEGFTPGSPTAYEMKGGHANLGLPVESLPVATGSGMGSDTHYFAEGATAGGFDTWLLLCNTATQEATATINLMTEEGEAVEETVSIPALSRQSVHLDDYLPDAFQVATEVTSDRPLVAERSMYWDPNAAALSAYQMMGGHSNDGSPAPATDWYLAEGSTGGGFETYILIQNPQEEEAQVTASFMTGAGIAHQEDFTLGARSRTTLEVSEYVPDQFHVATWVTSDRAVVAERSMYWDKSGDIPTYAMRDGHSTVGLTYSGPTWLVPEGSTGGGFDSWVLITNPTESEVAASVTFMTAMGPEEPIEFAIPGHSRYTLRISDYLEDEFQVSTLVGAEGDVVVERAMYWNRWESPGIQPYEMMGGHSSVGVVP